MRDEICSNCGRRISHSEQAYARDERVLCGVCYQRLSSTHELVPSGQGLSNQNDSDDYCIDLVAAELKKDISSLMELGIKLDKGKLAAETGGLIGAGASAFTGHWLSALVIGGASLLAGGFTKSYHRIKIKEVCLKWHNILSSMDQEQLSILMAGLQERYPVLLGRFQNLLQAVKEQ